MAARLNDPANPNHIPGGRIVMALPGGNSEAHLQHASVLQDKFGVRIVEATTDFANAVDAIMLLNGEETRQISLVLEIMPLGKPLYIEPPVAITLEGVVSILAAAEKVHIPLFSACSISPSTTDGSTAADAAIVTAPMGSLEAALFSPSSLAAVESLFDVMGPDCEVVQALRAGPSSTLVGGWSGDRQGTLVALHALPPESAVHVTSSSGATIEDVPARTITDLSQLLRAVIDFFATGTPPVSARQTLAVHAFLQAAYVSEQTDGRPVKLSEVLTAAGFVPPPAEAPAVSDPAPGEATGASSPQ